MEPVFNSEIQTWTKTTASLTDVITVTATISVGDFIVIPWQQASNGTVVLSSVSDSSGSNTWTVCTPNTNDPNRTCGIAFAYMNAGLVSGTGTITLHWSAATNVFKMGSFLDFGGIAPSSILNAQAVSAAPFGTSVSNPITTTGTVLIVYAQGQEQTNVYTVGGSFTAVDEVTNNSRLDYGYRIVTANGTYNPAGSYPTNTNWLATIAAFNVAVPPTYAVEDYGLTIALGKW